MAGIWFDNTRHLSSEGISRFSGGEIKLLHPLELTSSHYIQLIDEILRVPRTGWILPERGIPWRAAETTSAHGVKVGILAVMYALYIEGIDDVELLKRIGEDGVLHDFCDGGHRDVPHLEIQKGIITPTEKKQLEREALVRYAKNSGDTLPLRIYDEMDENPNSPKNRIIKQCDKISDGALAINYHQIGFYGVGDFFEYTQNKVTNPFLHHAYGWLLKQEFPMIDNFYLLCCYIYFKGDLTKLREHVRKMRQSSVVSRDAMQCLEIV